MKRLILFFLFAVSNAYAASPFWNLSIVQNGNGQKVGAIYHTEAVGQRYEDTIVKSSASLRLICDTTAPENSVIAIVWDGMNGYGSGIYFYSKIDNQLVNQEYQWVQEKNIFYRSLNKSSKILSKMSNGKIVEFDGFDASGTRRTVKFSLIGFSTFLSEFNNTCLNK